MHIVFVSNKQKQLLSIYLILAFSFGKQECMSHIAYIFNVTVSNQKIEMNGIYYENQYMPCLSRDRKGDPCRYSTLDESRFCKFHQYMTSYTDPMLQQLELCSGCKKMYYLGGERKICDNCADRSKAHNIAKKENVVLCAKESCVNKRSIENKYCKLHKLQLFVDETASENKKLCKGYIRGCRMKLEQSYEFTKCSDCLESDRTKDTNRRNRALDTEVDSTTEKTCTTCCKVLPLEQFAGMRTAITITCQSCRDANKTQDANRDREHRNEVARVNDSKPERVLVKQEWKENNYEKVAEYIMNSKQHRMERDGIDGYLQANAEQAKKWRDENPEKVQEANENKINSYESQYNIYQRSADLKQLEFAISFDEFKEIVIKPCNYCGIVRDRGTEQFNGIDRINSDIGYVANNCVSCCPMCNYMKNTLSCDIFIRRIQHILTYNKLIDGNLNPGLFGDHNNVVFARYRERAVKKGLECSITTDEFDAITTKDCYMCGKQCSITHNNGIDRYDNNIGYTIDNCRPCCGECNYMKREYSYQDVFEKFMMICKCNPIPITIPVDNTIHSLSRGNKKTPEQIREEARLRKQKQRTELQAKYGDEEYKKKHAKEIADARAKRKQLEN